MILRRRRFASGRKNQNQALGRGTSAESIVEGMLKSKENWLTSSSSILKIRNELLDKVKKEDNKEGHESLKEDPEREVILKCRSW